MAKSKRKRGSERGGEVKIGGRWDWNVDKYPSEGGIFIEARV